MNGRHRTTIRVQNIIIVINIVYACVCMKRPE